MSAATPCPSCGVPGSGAFCASCGTARGVRHCSGCGRAIAAGERFCSGCGAPAAGSGAGAPGPAGRMGTPGWAYLLAGIVVLGVVLVAVWAGAEKAPPAAAATSSASPQGAEAIDLSTMTPRERFDRLYDRVMRASEGGDEATVTQFSPMALAAYTQLDSIDTDARYHAAMIRMHTGDLPGAAALADTIRTTMPTHLFSYVIHGTLARQRGDQDRLRQEQATFLQHYQPEMALERPEYAQHAVILDMFVGEARAAKP